MHFSLPKKIHNTSKRSLYMVAALLFVVAAVGSPLLSPKAYAAGEKYFFYYPNDSNKIKDIEERVGDYDNDKDGSSMKETSVIAQGGFWDKLGTSVKLTYDNDLTKTLASGNNADDKFMYGIQYTCYNNGATLKLGDTAVSQSYYLIKGYMQVDLNSGTGSFDKEKQYDSEYYKKGYVDKYSITYFGEKPAQAPPGQSTPERESRRVDFDKEKNSIVSCLPLGNFDGNQPDKLKTLNYFANKDQFNGDPDNSANGGSSSSNPSSGNSEEDPCEATSTPLSWIICPVLEMGISFTDFVFKDFVEPLLENVPVSTEADDGSYKAWKQFRLIGNIVLIGTLLAVVYSQVKGER